MMSETVLWVAPLLASQALLIWRYWVSLKKNDAQAESIARLLSQVKTLQADPNSWQSGYTAGRKIGTSTALAEREQLNRLYLAAKQDVANLRQMIDETIGEKKP